MFPLSKKTLIRGSDAHIKAGLGAGMDYRANFVSLIMPFDGKIDRIYTGAQGGKWLDIVDRDGIRLQFAHLSEYHVEQGDSAKQGQTIAKTGNSGAITTAPHLHIQGVKNGKRVRLDNYDWDKFNNQPPNGGGNMPFRVHQKEEDWFRETYGQAVGVFKQGGPSPADADYAYNVLRKGKYKDQSAEGCLQPIIREQFADELSPGFEPVDLGTWWRQK